MKHWYENDFVTGLAPVIQQADDVQFIGYPEYDWAFRVGIWASSFWLEVSFINGQIPIRQVTFRSL